MAALFAAKIFRSLDLEFRGTETKINYLAAAKYYFSTNQYFYFNSTFITFLRDFESLAHDLLEYCYQNDKNKAREMLLLEAEQFGNKNCLEIVQYNFEITKATDENENLKKFVAHECFQNLVTYIWNGENHNIKTWEFYIYIIFCMLLSPILLLCCIPYHVSQYFYK
jgi:hypothetical protein